MYAHEHAHSTFDMFVLYVSVSLSLAKPSQSQYSRRCVEVLLFPSSFCHESRAGESQDQDNFISIEYQCT